MMRRILEAVTRSRAWLWLGIGVLLALPVAVAWAGGWLDGSEPTGSSPSRPAAVPSKDNDDSGQPDQGQAASPAPSAEEDEEHSEEEEHQSEGGGEGEHEQGEGEKSGAEASSSAHEGGDGGVPVDVARRPVGTFIPSLSTRRALVWAVGDGGNASEVAKAVARRIARTRPKRVLYLGDVYDWDGAAGFARQYGSVYGRLGRVTAPTPGNHDTPTQAGYDPYWRRIKGKSPPSFYSFRLAGWQILSLNSEVDHGSQSTQVRWLRARLRRGGTCRLAFWHRPRYSAGTHHGDQEDMAPVWDALRGRASVVVAGHEHDMQRFKPIDGITEFVSGAGGKGLYGIERDDRLAFGNDQEHGALRLRLSSGLARFAFVSAGGRTLDSGAVRCRA